MDILRWSMIVGATLVKEKETVLNMNGKNYFGRLPMLPTDWWYYLNQHGEGKRIDYPIKVKVVIAWSPQKHNQGRESCRSTTISYRKIKCFICSIAL